MDKAYDHHAFEDDLYASWEQSGKMYADNTSDKPPFVIPLPPPNVTGQLHLGHAAMLAIEDILIRYKRMTGHEVLWIPGTDHAAIATENVVIKHHKKKSREEWPSREVFLRDAEKFASEKHNTIVNQMKKMGAWLDWSREAYTFDQTRNQAVNNIFVKLYEDGLIERGYRMINWSSGAQSVLSDEELEWEDVKEPFYYIRCGKFIVGTVRSETKCSNSPVIVNPDGEYIVINDESGDELILSRHAWENETALQFLKENFREKKSTTGHQLVGEKFKYQTYAGIRNFWVIADNVIDMKKGTGAMTISASHSEDDYELTNRLNLKDLFFTKIDKNGCMTELAGDCMGMTVEEARRKSAEIMEEQGILIAKNTHYTHRVPRCYRSNCVVEPMVSPQWFLLVDKEFTCKFSRKNTTFKKILQDAVRKNHVKIIPEHFGKTYFHWIDNLRDWCISRQIWWGHQIPVWYDDQGEIAQVGEVNGNVATANLTQDSDTLDTWFSSALWPFSILGWDGEKNNHPDFLKFYPTSVLETGHDILFFWVARMLMFGYYATGRYPFHTVYLHGLVTDEHGKKMSKSKGNGIDPLEVIDEVGADAVRLSLVVGTSPGNPIPIGKNKIKGYRNFINKLWNAGRFVQMQEFFLSRTQDVITPQSLSEKWIYARFSLVAKEVAEHLEKYEISSAGNKIYHFVWDEFCSWYLESFKIDGNGLFLRQIFAKILQLTHSLCPFITETLWRELGYGELLITEDFPRDDFSDDVSIESFACIQSLLGEIRNRRAESGINPKDKIAAKISAKISEEEKKLLENFGALDFDGTLDKISAKISQSELEIEISLPVDEEKQKKEKTDLEKKATKLRERLRNKKYVESAPSALVEQTKKELLETEAKLKIL